MCWGKSKKLVQDAKEAQKKSQRKKKSRRQFWVTSVLVRGPSSKYLSSTVQAEEPVRNPEMLRKIEHNLGELYKMLDNNGDGVIKSDEVEVLLNIIEPNFVSLTRKQKVKASVAYVKQFKPDSTKRIKEQDICITFEDWCRRAKNVFMDRGNSGLDDARWNEEAQDVIETTSQIIKTISKVQETQPKNLSFRRRNGAPVVPAR